MTGRRGTEALALRPGRSDARQDPARRAGTGGCAGGRPALAPERLGGRWAPPPLAGPWLGLTFGGARDHAAPYLVLQAGKLRQRGPDLTLRI